MRKSIIIFFAGVTALVSCNRNEINPQDECSYLKAEAPSDADFDVKTSLGDKSGNTYPIIWKAGDAISVNGANSDALAEADITSGGKSANFKVNAVLTAPLKAVYPLSAVNAYSDGEYKVKFQEIQHFTSGSFDPTASVMLAYTTNLGNISFQNTLSYLKLTVSGSGEKIKYIRIEGNGAEALSGVFSTVFSEEKCSITSERHGGAVTLDCGDAGVDLGTEMIVAIPSKSYSQGINILVCTVSGKYQKVVSNKLFEAAPGKIYSTSFAFKETSGYELGIYTEADLIAFLADADGCAVCNNYSTEVAKEDASFGDYSRWKASDGEVHIKNDITLTKTVDWSMTASNRSCCISNFDGILNGEGHTITIEGNSSNYRTPLITNLYGTVKNLILEGEMKADHAPKLIAALANTVQAGGCIQNVTSKVNIVYDTHIDDEHSGWNLLRAGGIADFVWGTVKDCVNEGAIAIGGEVASTAVGSAGIGGVCSVIYEGGLVSGCENKGQINTSILSSDGSTWVAGAGGVCYYVQAEGSIINCTNSANLNAGKTVELGGVISSARSNGISGCHNTGNITCEDDNTTTTIGGVINFIGSGYEMTDCTNSGTITCGGSPEAGGVIKSAYGTVKNCTNSGNIITNGNSTTRAAGVARSVQSTGVLDGCKNTADINFNEVYSAGITLTNAGNLKDCINEGNLSVTGTSRRLGGIVYDNQNIMSGCRNKGAISTDQQYTNLAGVVVLQSSSKQITDCDNSGAISVTGLYSRAGGICFNMIGGVIDQCDNSGNISITVSPSAAGIVEFMGGIVAIVSKENFALPTVQNIFATGGRKNPASDYPKNILSSKLTVSNCVNTGLLTMTVTPNATTSYVRNVAIGGIVGWNWAKTSADCYLEIKNCTCGVEGKSNYYVQYVQTSNMPSYLSPALGGIVGQSAPYDADSGTVTITPYTGGYASSYSEGMRIVLDGCKVYGNIANLVSYSTGPGSPSIRGIRGTGGLAGVIYGGNSDALRAEVLNCKSKAYVFNGNTKDNDSKQSMENCCGGVAGAAANIYVSGCNIEGQIGSYSRYLLCCGGVFGSATEKYVVENNTIHPVIGYTNNKNYTYYGIVAGGSNYQSRTKGYTTINGSRISGNKIQCSTLKVNGAAVTVNSTNFTDYLVSANDATNNATNKWLTIENNTWE